MTGLFSQTVSLGFCVVLGSGRTVIGMSHFLVAGGLEQAHGKHPCGRLSNSLFLLGFALSFRTENCINAA